MKVNILDSIIKVMSLKFFQMCQCLDLAYETVDKVIFHQIHHKDFCKDSALFCTANMFDKIQSVPTSVAINRIQSDLNSVTVKDMQGFHTSAAEDRKSDHEPAAVNNSFL